MYQYIVQIIYARNVCRNLSQIIVIYHKIVTLSESPEQKLTNVLHFWCKTFYFMHTCKLKATLRSCCFCRDDHQDVGAKRRNPAYLSRAISSSIVYLPRRLKTECRSGLKTTISVTTPSTGTFPYVSTGRPSSPGLTP